MLKKNLFNYIRPIFAFSSSVCPNSPVPGKAGGGLGFLFLFITLLLTSCSDKDTNPDIVLPDSTGLCEITLNIPALDFGMSSRADNIGIDVTEEECKLQDLYLVIFRINPNTAVTEFYSCEDIASSISPLNPTVWKNYTLSLPSGTYKFYLLANISQYVDVPTGKSFKDVISTEAGIASLVMKFSGAITPGNIPMACMADNVRIGSSADTNKASYGEVEVTENSLIYAPLSLLCSKVRYTILFDNTPSSGFSSAFSSSDIDVSPVSAFSIADNTPILVPTTSPGYLFPVNSENTGGESLDIYPVVYPARGSLYLEESGWDGSETPDPLEKLETGATWTNTSQRAWQGVAYFPENIHETDTDANRTQLHFAGTGDGFPSEGYMIPIAQLERGDFYDIVGRLKTPDNIAISINIHVNSWAYTDIDISW